MRPSGRRRVENRPETTSTPAMPFDRAPDRHVEVDDRGGEREGGVHPVPGARQTEMERDALAAEDEDVAVEAVGGLGLGEPARRAREPVLGPVEQRRAAGAGRGIAAPRRAERDPGRVGRLGGPDDVRVRRVGDHPELRVRRADLAPLLGDRPDLAESVELVAGEVAEHEQLGIERIHHLRQPPLVDLDDRHLRGPVPRRARRRCPRACSHRCGWWPPPCPRRAAPRPAVGSSSSCRSSPRRVRRGARRPPRRAARARCRASRARSPECPRRAR